jgi:hypothetical protein
VDRAAGLIVAEVLVGVAHGVLLFAGPVRIRFSGRRTASTKIDTATEIA